MSSRDQNNERLGIETHKVSAHTTGLPANFRQTTGPRKLWISIGTCARQARSKPGAKRHMPAVSAGGQLWAKPANTLSSPSHSARQ